MDLTKVEIQTERLKIIPISTNYAEEIYREFNPEVTRYMYPKPAESLSDTLYFLNIAQQLLLQGEDLSIVILKKGSKEFLGGGGINHVNTPTPQLGIWIKMSAHGNKYGREAVNGLKEWADENLKYDYLTYPVDKSNIASRKIAESLGGVIKKEYTKINKSGNTLDEVEYWIYKNQI